MKHREARERAARLGLSVWVLQPAASGGREETPPLKCIGFASVGVPIAEAETWDEALAKAIRIIFSA